MRLKYPHITIGALASSAPILQFEDIVPPETFYNIVSNDFRVRLNFLDSILCLVSVCELGKASSNLTCFFIVLIA